MFARMQNYTVYYNIIQYNALFLMAMIISKGVKSEAMLLAAFR